MGTSASGAGVGARFSSDELDSMLERVHSELFPKIEYATKEVVGEIGSIEKKMAAALKGAEAHYETTMEEFKKTHESFEKLEWGISRGAAAGMEHTTKVARDALEHIDKRFDIVERSGRISFRMILVAVIVGAICFFVGWTVWASLAQGVLGARLFFSALTFVVGFGVSVLIGSLRSGRRFVVKSVKESEPIAKTIAAADADEEESDPAKKPAEPEPADKSVRLKPVKKTGKK